MPFEWNPREHLSLARYAIKWLVIATVVAIPIGAAVAVFLWALDRVTHLRWNHPWLLYFLPLAGLVLGALYQWLGKSVEGGNNLLMEQIHEPGGGVPARMAPLILVGTVLTHLFGGSAGREGTAVQMGGSIASSFSRATARWHRWTTADIRTLLMVGVAAGFGAVCRVRVQAEPPVRPHHPVFAGRGDLRGEPATALPAVQRRQGRPDLTAIEGSRGSHPNRNACEGCSGYSRPTSERTTPDLF